MKLLNQLKDLVSKNQDKITGGLGKVTSQIDKRTGGKFSDKLEKVNSTVEGGLEKLSTEDINLTDPAVDVTDDVAGAADTAAGDVSDVAEETAGS